MDEYTFENLIINPETPGLADLIGKEVYCDNTPLACLQRANKSYEVGVLREICKDDYRPFYVKYPNGIILSYACIIPKKEEPKPKYVPFESKEEFVDRYDEVMKGAEYASFEDELLQCGMWLKDADDNNKPVYRLVSEIRNEGVRISEYGCFNWEELLSKGFLFPNDRPCGKLIEVEHEQD